MSIAAALPATPADFEEQAYEPEHPKVARLPSAAPDFEIDGRKYEFLPEGDYLVRFTYYETFLFGREKQNKAGSRPRSKLALWFTIASDGGHFGGEYVGRSVAKFYNVTELIGEPRRSGRFRAGPRSNFIMDYYRLFSSMGRMDRVSFDPFRQNAFIARVGTVAKVQRDRQHVELPDQLKYSVVRHLELYRP